MRLCWWSSAPALVWSITTQFPQRQTKPSGVETPHKRKKPDIYPAPPTDTGLMASHTQSWPVNLVVPAALMASPGPFHHHHSGWKRRWKELPFWGSRVWITKFTGKHDFIVFTRVGVCVCRGGHEHVGYPSHFLYLKDRRLFGFSI